jgi:hypothetical protein
MAPLRSMPPIVLSEAELARFGRRWNENGERLRRSRPESSMEFGKLFDAAVASSLSTMLGGVAIKTPTRTALTPVIPDCLETGDVRIIGGVRPQNFDIGYRPDGVRIAYDSKTLNDSKSVRKNYQNMINDLATEATTVHSRFPYAVFVFLVVIPSPCLGGAIEAALTLTLERLAQRNLYSDPAHLAEAAALVVWDPASGAILPDRPAVTSDLRIEKMHSRIERIYRERYKGLPPHVEAPEEDNDVEDVGE